MTWECQAPEAGSWESTHGSRSGAPRDGARMGPGATACRRDGDRKWVGESSPPFWGSPAEGEESRGRPLSGWAWALALREGGNGGPSGDEGLGAGAGGEGRNGWGPHASPWDTESSGGGWEGLALATALGTPGDPLPEEVPASPLPRNAVGLWRTARRVAHWERLLDTSHRRSLSSAESGTSRFAPLSTHPRFQDCFYTGAAGAGKRRGL